MINVMFYYDNQLVRGFVVKGHAGAAPRGEDVVCAGVSALTQTAILGLNTYLSQKPHWKIEENGYLECWLPEGLSEADRQKVDVLIGTLELGLKSIVEGYGQYLQVCKRRWTECCSK